MLIEEYKINLPKDIPFSDFSMLKGDIGDQPNQPTRGAHIYINSKMEYQTIKGLGGAFSELGGKAYESLDIDKKQEVLNALFNKTFNYFRLPIGSSDFGIDAYSLDDFENDFSMENFSIERDRKYLIPLIKSGKGLCENMKIHGSPWSPPWWLKENKNACGGGNFINEEKHYDAYVKYFVRFIEEYKKEGIDINRLLIQNEPDAHPGYPGCDMTFSQMAKIIKKLYKAFKESNIETSLWAGTFRSLTGASGCDFLTSNEDITDYIEGIGCQYCTQQALLDISLSNKNVGLMHTESNCFNGDNTWAQAIFLYINMLDYLNAGCDVYSYWNMILNENGKSSWGWKQNSMITINETTKEVTYNPDYYIMKLMSKCLKPNSKRIVYSSLNKRGFAVKGENGDITFVISNFSDKQEEGEVTIDFTPYPIILEPFSIASYTLKNK